MKHSSKVLLLCFGALLILSMAVWAGGQKEREEKVEKIRVMNYWSGKDRIAFDLGMEVFKATYPEIDVSVHYLGGTGVDFMTTVMTMLAGKVPPDVSSMWSGARVVTLAKEGAIIELTDFWEEVGFDETTSPWIKTTLCTYDGKIMFVPHVIQLMQLVFYNKHVFEDLDLSEPTTWAEFENILATIKAAGITPISVSSGGSENGELFTAILSRLKGISVWDQLEKAEIAWTHPDVVEAANVLRGWAEKGYFNSDAREIGWTEWASRVARGDAAMLMRDTWMIKDFQARELVPGVDFGIFTLPRMVTTIPVPGFIYADGWVIYTDAANIGDAKLWVKTLLGVDAQKAHSLFGGHGLPVNLDVDSGLYPPYVKWQVDLVRTEAIYAFGINMPPGFWEPDALGVLLDLIVDLTTPVMDVLGDIDTLVAEFYY